LPAKTSEEDTIRAVVDSYVAAYNRGDAQAVADHWSDKGIWTSPSGDRIQGRAAIAKELTKMFAETRGVQIDVDAPKIHFATPDVAVEEGTVYVRRPNETAEASTYVAIHVKTPAGWKLDSVHETEVEVTGTTVAVAAAASPIEALAWLVGSWSDQSEEAAFAAEISWTKNRTFLNFNFKADAENLDELEGVQVIGWDAAGGTIRSWMFDSDGGFGEGTWTHDGKNWMVKFRQTLPDGRVATATNVYTLIDDNKISWRSIGRKVGDEFLPNVDDVVLVRKPASNISSGAEVQPTGFNK
jgi:uncharacterized protein (TIGR02246 family)